LVLPDFLNLEVIALKYGNLKIIPSKKYNNIAQKPVIHPESKYCNLL
jgi:hypothetical protein